MFCHFLDHKWQSQDPRLLWWDNGQEAKPFKIHVRFCIWILKNQMERNVVAGDIRICKQSVQTCKGFELMAAPCEVPPCWVTKGNGGRGWEEDPTDWVYHGPDPTVYIIHLTYSSQHGEYPGLRVPSAPFSGLHIHYFADYYWSNPIWCLPLPSSTFPMMDTRLPLQPPTTTPSSHTTFQL